MFNVSGLVRPNILALAPYSSARNDFAGTADVFLDANENAFGSPAGSSLNRYPDPLQRELKARLADIYAVDAANIFVGNGSDEAIDLLFRTFCVPGSDEVIICPPTYGMYKVYADINDVRIRVVPLNDSFDLDVEGVAESTNDRSKLMFVCSPNNPTGNLMSRDAVLQVVREFPGIVVVDEAYADFADERSLKKDLKNFPNLVVLRTCSKAWGMAALRIGLAFASTEIIELLNRVKPPYNLSKPAQESALEGLSEQETVDEWLTLVKRERSRLANELLGIHHVQHVYPSDANFLLVRFTDADAVYERLIEHGVVVRNRSRVFGCEGSLRITIGTPAENEKVLHVLKEMS